MAIPIKHEFYPASLALMSLYREKSLAERTKLIEDLIERADRKMKHDTLRQELPDSVPFGMFCPTHKEAILMGVKLGVFIV